MDIFAQKTTQMLYNTAIILDTRRNKKGTKLYPVKLRVYSIKHQINKHYATKYYLTKEDFKSIIETTKPRLEHKALRNEILAIDKRADEISKELKPFSFTSFEKKFLRNTGEGNNVIYHYKVAMQKLQSNNAFGTASNYELSLKSIKEFISKKKEKKSKAEKEQKEILNISFSEITPDWLSNYEKYMLDELKRSRTTVSMYVRALRTIFNTAISEKEIDAEVYPFGKNKYQPPTVKSAKKALSQKDLNKLFKAKVKTPEQEKAKDFWFFSFSCNGMNVKDIALLRYEDIKGDTFTFYRAKTINTSKSDLRPVTVYLNSYTKSIIEKYGNKPAKKSEYVFPIISTKLSELEKHTKIKNFTKFINQNLKKLALSNAITSDISTYWARHSYATSAIRNGASMEFMMEALSHNNMKTTVGYFAGFEDKDKKDFSENLMKFLSPK